MVHTKTGATVGTPALARTSNLNEDLGQVSE